MWSMSESLMPVSVMTSWNGFLVRSSRSLVRSWNLARVSCSSRWTGPSGVTERYCREMLVLVEEESSFLACSAASRRRSEERRVGKEWVRRGGGDGWEEQGMSV